MIEIYKKIRNHTVFLCSGLTAEDSAIQPIIDVSPPKWHLAHTSWFFETFVLQKVSNAYIVFNKNYNFLFNSYYEGIGDRVPRNKRGNISRPGLQEILKYRQYVDEAMLQIMERNNLNKELLTIIELGLQHEQQHQELLTTDIKYILSTNPTFPAYNNETKTGVIEIVKENFWLKFEEGIYDIGYHGQDFCFDNELGRHKVFLHSYEVQKFPVSNREFLDFINDGGYQNYNLWLADGWEWVNTNNISAPLYWLYIEGKWKNFTLNGLQLHDLEQPVCHVNFYEADAYARWKDARLLTEFEWEIASKKITYGERWEWTNSAYLPYPYFTKAIGAIGEYNGKFMINQMVLRGGSIATPEGHSRPTYRNFFSPDKQWQYSGIRLARTLNLITI